MVVQHLWAFAKNRTGLRVFDVGFHRHRTLGFQGFHELRNDGDDGDVVVFFIHRAFDHTAKTTHRTFENHTGVTGDHAANTGTRDDEHLIRSGFDNGRQAAAGDHETAEYAYHQYDQTNNCCHLSLQMQFGTSKRNLGCACLTFQPR